MEAMQIVWMMQQGPLPGGNTRQDYMIGAPYPHVSLLLWKSITHGCFTVSVHGRICLGFLSPGKRVNRDIDACISGDNVAVVAYRPDFLSTQTELEEKSQALSKVALAIRRHVSPSSVVIPSRCQCQSMYSTSDPQMTLTARHSSAPLMWKYATVEQI